MRPSAALSSALVVLAVTACRGPLDPRGGATGTPGTVSSDRREGVSVPSASCSEGAVPLRRPDVRAVAFARGDGPVYVGLGTPGKVPYTEDTREHDGWYYYKTLWAVAPVYEGPVSITGHQLDGPHPLLFSTGPGFPGTKLTRLEMPEDPSGGWRFGPSDTLIRAPGCYAFEVEGEGFRQSITFVTVD